MMSADSAAAFVAAPDPGSARTLGELIERLRALKIWAGDPSYEVITDRINAAWTAHGRPPGELARRGTVVDCFKVGRRRVNTDLLVAAVQALHPDRGYVTQWRQALHVVLGEAYAAVQVRAQDTLPADLPEFTGRTAELRRLQHSTTDGTVVISAIEGMAGVGKTQLAVHAGHLLAREQPFDHVLFVDLRGFHPDPGQPPADPAAVLDAFLRLLGVPGQQIPHGLAGRVALYRRLLAGRRALVVLDNAASEDQIRPLLAGASSGLTMVTSRRRLADLTGATHLTLDVFSTDEAADFLRRAAPDVPVGEDADSVNRVAHRCGHLPLALGLAAAQMRAGRGWTVTDHADRLDERHRNHRLDSGVELTMRTSYQRLPAETQHLFRALALHPGHDFDGFAAAALAGCAMPTAAEHLRRLRADHLLQEPAAGRYTFHDLIRTYAADLAGEEDRPAHRRDALTRLLDCYLFAAATAMDVLYPTERQRRPRVAVPAAETPRFADVAAAKAWLDTERDNLADAAARATHEWPQHATAMATTLYRYLDSGGHHTTSVTVHTQAARAARHCGNREAEGHALMSLGAVHGQMGDHERAAEHHQQALALYREIGDRNGEARTLGNLGIEHWRMGKYRTAADSLQRALRLYREVGDRFGEAIALTNLGNVGERLGRYEEAADYHCQALRVFREIGERFGEVVSTNLGLVFERLGRHHEAEEMHWHALDACREFGDRHGEAESLNGLGVIHRHARRYRTAIDHHQLAVTLCREIGDRGLETAALNSLGETLLASEQPDEAATNHVAALAIAEEIGERYEQARAHNGLARCRRAVDDAHLARHHWQHALKLYTEMELPDADQVRADLTALGHRPPAR
jgi:tetratricopeptide (TPR) repeat protein